MGGSVGPRPGPGWLLVGDSAGTVNPFNGEGIDYAYETGRMAAESSTRRWPTRDPTALQRYAKRLDGSSACTSRWPGCSPRSSAGRR